MGDHKETRIPRTASVSGGDYHERPLGRNRQPRTENGQTFRGEAHTHERAKSLTNMSLERKDTFHAVADDFFSKAKPATFEHRSCSAFDAISDHRAQSDHRYSLA